MVKNRQSVQTILMPNTNCELEEQATNGMINTQVMFYTVSLISAEENNSGIMRKYVYMRIEYDMDVDSITNNNDDD